MSRSALDRLEQQEAARIKQINAPMVYQPPHQMMPGIVPQMMPGMVPHMMPGMMPQMMPGMMLPYGIPPPQQAFDIEEKKKDEIPQTNGNTFNVNKLVLDRIYGSDFYNSLYECNTFQEICDEITKKVKHVEPWATGTSRTPSSAWCLLVKLFKIRLTVKQVNSMIRRYGSPYIRALGFLYLRMVTEPKHLWDWMEEFIDDEENFPPSANPELMMTMGKFCIKILSDMHFYETVLPRIPVPIERKLKAYMILAEEEHRRSISNMRHLHILKTGTKIQAIYKDDENEPAFYEATVQEVVDSDIEGGKPKVVVTYNEYGNTECISLGKIMIPETDHSHDDDDDQSSSRRNRSRDRDGRKRSRSRDREHSRRHRSRSRSRERRDGRRDDGRDKDRKGRSPPQDNTSGGGSLLDSVMNKVAERDRNNSAANGKDYASRPASYKGSLSLKLDRFTHRKKSRSRSPEITRGDRRERAERAADRREKEREHVNQSEVYESRHRGHHDEAKARYLKDRYGDASTR